MSAAGSPHVLVIEDSELDRKVACRSLLRLDSASYRVSTAGCLADVRQRPGELESVSVILLDLELPDSTGLETISKVQSLFPDAPIIVMIGNEEAMALEAISRGAQDYLQKMAVTPESLHRAIRYATERSRLLNEIKDPAIRDPLTEIYTRRYFFDQASIVFKAAIRHQQPLSVMIIDCDNFKRVNDKFGHQAGDEILKKIAGHLQNIARETDLVARYGGEEFVALLPQTPRDGAVIMGERIRAAVASRPMETSGGDLVVTVSVGVATATAEMEYVEDAIKLADQMLMRAKNNGKNRVETATAGPAALMVG
jgi:diguanylate cyclase (GGDEF)-like protein